MDRISAEGVARTLEESLKRLQTDYVDLHDLHRVAPDIPLEEMAGWMGDLIKIGKIRAWRLSEANEDEIRRANAITPLSAVQNEFSMMERKWEKDAIPVCGELGIGFVSFSPIAGAF